MRQNSHADLPESARDVTSLSFSRPNGCPGGPRRLVQSAVCGMSTPCRAITICLVMTATLLKIVQQARQLSRLQAALEEAQGQAASAIAAAAAAAAAEEECAEASPICDCHQAAAARRRCAAPCHWATPRRSVSLFHAATVLACDAAKSRADWRAGGCDQAHSATIVAYI